MDKREKMYLLVAQWRESGLTRKAFAQQHGLTDHTLEYWSRKQGNTIKEHTSTQPCFIELTPKPDSKSLVREDANHVKLELELPGGIRIKIYS